MTDAVTGFPGYGPRGRLRRRVAEGGRSQRTNGSQSFVMSVYLAAHMPARMHSATKSSAVHQ